MFGHLREPFGKAGLVVAIVALLAALVGGAYAAGGGLSGKQKKEVRGIAKKEAKKYGAQGPAGPQGPSGVSGKDGLNGLDGAPGEAGKGGGNGRSVALSETASGCAEGGITVEVEGSGEPLEICNGEAGQAGEDGKPWTAGGTLPKGSTETGSWSMGTVTKAPESFASEFVFAPVSFAIPLEASLDEPKVHYINPAGEEVIGLGTTQPPATCTGNSTHPTAPAGELCVYASLEQGASEFKMGVAGIAPIGSADYASAGASTTGALLKFAVLAEGVFAFGTFAVTG